MSASPSKALRTLRRPATVRPYALPEPAAAILDVLQRGERFVVCSHARPDGDAVGSVLALGMLLEQMGKRVDLVSADPVPVVYQSLPGTHKIQVAQRVGGEYDAAILLECDGLERTGLTSIDSNLLINIDHHYSGREFAQLNWIDRSAASVGEMVYRLVKAAGAHISGEMATCLYTTLLTDTGGFSYGAVDASTFEIARELVLAGADPVRIAQEVWFSAPMSKMRVLGAALNNLRREGPVAWLWITHEDMVRIGAAEEDCEGVVNVAVGMAEVRAAAFLRELADGRVRVSLRSKGELNVAAIAEGLGGGGHKNAAGCTLQESLSGAKKSIPMLLSAALDLI